MSTLDASSFQGYGPEYLDSLLSPTSPLISSDYFFSRFPPTSLSHQHIKEEVSEDSSLGLPGLGQDSQVCTVCGNGVSACFYCSDCPDYLCQACYDKHAMFRSLVDHNVNSLGHNRLSISLDNTQSIWANNNNNIKPFPAKKPVLQLFNTIKKEDNQLSQSLSPIFNPQQIALSLKSASANPITSPLPPFNTSTPYRFKFTTPHRRPQPLLREPTPYLELMAEGHSQVDFPLFTFGGEGQEDGQLNRPWGICCDQKGRIIVSDRSNNRIQIYNAEGHFLMNFGYFGVNPGELNRPAGVAVNKWNHIIVADKDNHRIQVFSENGQFLFKFGQSGRQPGNFNYPWGIATNDRNEIAVTDSRNNRIQIFSEKGDLINMCGRNLFPMADKQIFGPRGIVFVENDKILVSDFNGHRLVLIDVKKRVDAVECFGTEGVKVGNFTRPQGMALDQRGNVYVCDSRTNRVQVVSIKEQRVISVLTSDFTLPLDRPCDITVGLDGRIYLVDFGHSSISVF